MQYVSYSNIRKIKAHLKKGGVIAYPTESCYGIGCDPLNYKAVSKVITIKQRSPKKGLILIAGSFKQLSNIIKPIPTDELPEIKKYWPGFFSLILDVQPKLPKNLIGQHTKIAVRVTKNKLVQRLCNGLDMPLVSTSANISGKYSIKTHRECLKQFGKKLLVIKGRTDFAKKPSTIIDWETKKVLR